MMPMDINSPFQIGAVTFAHRLVQGPLAGYTCAPYRATFADFQNPAYCVSEMISAHDLLHRQPARFVSRDAKEKYLAYQLSGTDPVIMAKAAKILEDLGADMIDINCGCPKTKIRKKGAGSALLTSPDRIAEIISTIKQRLTIPLTVKIRIQASEQDVALATRIEQAGADGLVVHGRRWQDNYATLSDRQQIGLIKRSVSIPVIANGDIRDHTTLQAMVAETDCDAYMLSRAGTGQPFLYQLLLQSQPGATIPWTLAQATAVFMTHVQGLAMLQNEHRAILQSRTLVRYYFKPWVSRDELLGYYDLDSFRKIEEYLFKFLISEPYEPRSS